MRIGSRVRQAAREALTAVTARTVRRADATTRVRSLARHLRTAVGFRGARAVALVVAVATLAFPGPAAAQSASSPSLEAAESAADSGTVERARELLDAWIATREGSATPGQRDRARFLEARLTEDPDSVRRLYARLAVEAGSEVAARARLRLAQLRLARSEVDAALGDLELVRADYPGSPAAAESWIWTGRAHRAAAAPEAACRAFGRAESTAAAAGLSDLRRRAEEARSGCDDGDVATGDDGADATPSTRWIVQLGAFREPSAAEGLRRRAEEAGFQARVVTTAADRGLHRVRVGRFGDRTAAAAVVRRLEDRGFRALIVEGEATEDGS